MIRIKCLKYIFCLIYNHDGWWTWFLYIYLHFAICSCQVCRYELTFYFSIYQTISVVLVYILHWMNFCHTKLELRRDTATYGQLTQSNIRKSLMRFSFQIKTKNIFILIFIKCSLCLRYIIFILYLATTTSYFLVLLLWSDTKPNFYWHLFHIL